jgi:large subunit ribosomal protein L30
MNKIKITQVKSAIDRPERQKLTLKALGLNKMNASREVEASAQILGMVRKVYHLLTVENVAQQQSVLPETMLVENETPVVQDVQPEIQPVQEEEISVFSAEAHTPAAADNA